MEPMHKSFRSCTTIIDAVNKVFSKLSDSVPSSVVQRWSELWVNHQEIYKDIPDAYKAKWFGRRDFEDDTMLLFAGAIWFWQFKNAISFFDIDEVWSTILSNVCSTINSAIFFIKSDIFLVFCDINIAV